MPEWQEIMWNAQKAIQMGIEEKKQVEGKCAQKYVTSQPYKKYVPHPP